MTGIDWALFATYLGVVVATGTLLGRKSTTSRSFFVADRSIPWWAVGLSVMATQASAITFIGTSGKAYADGMRFVQFYFGLPVAMLILAFTLMPLYHRAGVYTAYELLGQRFDAKTRLLSSAVFLVQRSASLGVIVYAPSVVLAMLLGWSLPATILTMTVLAVVYTVAGGIRAVIWTDVIQMVVIFLGLGVCLFAMLARLPAGIDFAGVLELASVTGKTRLIDTSFDPNERYTVWSGLLGGTFLFLSYFGCDQSQVQRFLAGRSLRDNRRALALNGLLKIPVQLFVLFLGVLLFVVFHFDRPPILFDGPVAERVAASSRGDEFRALESTYDTAIEARRGAAVAMLAERGQKPDLRTAYGSANLEVTAAREAAVTLAREIEPDYDDSNTVFPYFVLNYLPAGLVGLLLAAIFAAAMSSIDSELNALATISVVDLYRVHWRPDASDEQAVRATRFATLLWGVVAAFFALFAASLGSVIEAVNIVGSYFYGSLLGVFALAFATRRANGHGAFAGLLAGILAVAVADRGFELAWLWLNPLGFAVCIAVGGILSSATGAARYSNNERSS